MSDQESKEANVSPYPGIKFTATDNPILGRGRLVLLPPLPPQGSLNHLQWLEAARSGALAKTVYYFDEDYILPSDYAVVTELKDPAQLPISALRLAPDDMVIFEIEVKGQRHSIGFVVTETKPNTGVDVFAGTAVEYPHGIIFTYDGDLGSADTLAFTAVPVRIDSVDIKLGQLFSADTDEHVLKDLYHRYLLSVSQADFRQVKTTRVLHLRPSRGERQEQPSPVDVTEDTQPLPDFMKHR